MADAREEHVWTEHAVRDHTKIKPYEYCVEIDHFITKMDRKPKIVVDMGCGSGLWRPTFKDVHYIGIDQNQAMIDVAVRHYPDCLAYQIPDVPGVMTKIVDGYWNYKDTFFIRHNLRSGLDKVFEIQGKGDPVPWTLDIDFVWFSAVLQHNRESDKTEIMEQVAKILAPGKYLMFTETTFTPGNLPPGHVSFVEGMSDGWSYTRKGWIDYISKFGFKIIENEPFNFFLFERT